MAFKFRIEKGIHVKQDLFDKLCEARNMRLHGDLISVECAADKFTVVSHSHGTETFKAYGDEPSSVRLCNRINDDIQSEPERRKEFREQAEAKRKEKETKSEKTPTPRAERFAKHPASTAKFARW